MRALFVGGPMDGELVEVGDPAPAEWRALDHGRARLGLTVPRTATEALEGSYGRRDLAVELDGGRQVFTVYLAGPELLGFADPRLQPHLAQHVLRKLAAAGLVKLPGESIR